MTTTHLASTVWYHGHATLTYNATAVRLNKLCFWTLSIVWCLKKKTKLRN